jgi:hypothetical protein
MTLMDGNDRSGNVCEPSMIDPEVIDSGHKAAVLPYRATNLLAKLLGRKPLSGDSNRESDSASSRAVTQTINIHHIHAKDSTINIGGPGSNSHPGGKCDEVRPPKQTAMFTQIAKALWRIIVG